MLGSVFGCASWLRPLVRRRVIKVIFLFVFFFFFCFSSFTSMPGDMWLWVGVPRASSALVVPLLEMAEPHPGEYFWEIRFLSKWHHSRETSSDVPVQFCRFVLDRRSPKLYFSKNLVAIRSSSSLRYSQAQSWVIQKCMSLEYEPASEPVKSPQLIACEKGIELRLSGNEVYYSNLLILRGKNILFGKLHCQIFLNLIPFSYKMKDAFSGMQIGGRQGLWRTWRALPPWWSRASNMCHWQLCDTPGKG